MSLLIFKKQYISGKADGIRLDPLELIVEQFEFLNYFSDF